MPRVNELTCWETMFGGVTYRHEGWDDGHEIHNAHGAHDEPLSIHCPVEIQSLEPETDESVSIGPDDQSSTKKQTYKIERK